MGQSFELQPDTTRRVNGERRVVANPSNEEFITDYRDELTDMRSRLAHLTEEDPADVLATLSGVAGRLSEIRANLHRSSSPRATTLRVQEVDPLRDDLELQFKIHSRRIALLEWELRMSGGGI